MHPPQVTPDRTSGLTFGVRQNSGGSQYQSGSPMNTAGVSKSGFLFCLWFVAKRGFKKWVARLIIFSQGLKGAWCPLSFVVFLEKFHYPAR